MENHIKVKILKKRREVLEFRDEVKCKVNINGINKDIIYVMNSERGSWLEDDKGNYLDEHMKDTNYELLLEDIEMEINENDEEYELKYKKLNCNL